MFSNNDKFVDLHVLIIERRVATARNGRQYADLIIRSEDGSVLKCKLWNYSAANETITENGKVISITGDVSTYNGELQGTITLLMESNRKPIEFAKRSRFDIDEMSAKVTAIIDSFTEPVTKAVAQTLMASVRDLYNKAPAASGQHHAWYGGLLEHSTSMCEMGELLVKHYQGRYGKEKVSRDKVLFGCLFHDVGKAWEYDFSTPAFKRTPNGLMVGHIALGAMLVNNCANIWQSSLSDQDDPNFELERDHLIHLILSHHGRLDFGSPVVPCSLEAIILNHLDLLDSSFMHALELVEGKHGDVAHFSERSKTEKVGFLQLFHDI